MHRRALLPQKYFSSLIHDREEVGIEINVGKTKYKLLCLHQSAGQNHDIRKKKDR
jgi:hypothetical protein